MSGSTNKRLRIGIVDQLSDGWLGATSYTRMIIESLAQACASDDADLFILTTRPPESFADLGVDLRFIQLAAPPNLPGEASVRRLLRQPEKSRPLRGEARVRHRLRLADASDPFLSARQNKIDVLLPLLDVPSWKSPVKTIGWIPDFQHFKLPEFFPPSERRVRDRSLDHLANYATLVMLSSHSAREHFIEYAPRHAEKARVVPFPSLFAFAPPSGKTDATLTKFNLPRKFALVVNQFWAHKNHLAVVEAVRQVATRGIRIPVVMTGLPSDYRDPKNETMSRLLQSIASGNLSGQVMVLGHVKYADLINLMRAATVIIQPSRFEGWNTTVQDAKALGRPLFCSDIPVLREQAPKSMGFFPCDRPDVLADLLAGFWPHLQPGPNNQLESPALAAEGEFATRHGQALLELCREACG